MINLFETKSRTVPITKQMVKEAYRKVKANQGSAGVDKESLEEYQKDLLNNLYVIWNRLSSGSYFPKPVREVSIPKANGSKRILGIPTVSDRIAQQVIKAYLEPRLEVEFHNNSYGYRPLKSAHQAVETVRENVRQYAWVIDMDIKSFFDEVDHELLMKALDCHVEEKWVKMYVKRWLETPSQSIDGTLIPKDGKGTPQGGVISPLLSNLYLHYVLDKWLEKHYPQIAFVRYADDVVVHCDDENQAKQVLSAIRQRLQECKLRLNEEKTKLVYCKDYRRKEKKNYKKKFDFLGFTFKPQSAGFKSSSLYLVYDCAISQTAQTRIVTGWKKQNFHQQSTLTIQEIATEINPQMIGIIRYYGKYKKWALQKLVRHFHYQLAKWVLNKYKGLNGSYSRAYKWIKEIKVSYPNMFYHWQIFKHI
ncbi:MAG TPA: group II intron reverse transcriptase/maturase [Paenisporosarcina sp.]|nr:group II intron reverse transcriptase/maturase [Paenisporosarcina sp.]